jgi:hypothetical protein
MGWNPSPKVQDCRVIARKWGHQQVIVIALSPQSGKIEMATYGENTLLCRRAKILGDAAYNTVIDNYDD